jgi:hypothetical protein
MKKRIFSATIGGIFLQAYADQTLVVAKEQQACKPEVYIHVFQINASNYIQSCP